MRLIEGPQYDTIYHEHFSYYTLLTAQRVLADGRTGGPGRRGARLARWLAARSGPAGAARGTETPAVAKLLAEEERRGLHTLDGHRGFADAVARVKRDLVTFLASRACRGREGGWLRRSRQGEHPAQPLRHQVGPARYTVDRNPHKQGMYLPGTHIPILARRRSAARPDYILLLPWNLRAEISEQLEYTRQWGAKLVVPLPSSRSSRSLLNNPRGGWDCWWRPEILAACRVSRIGSVSCWMWSR